MGHLVKLLEPTRASNETLTSSFRSTGSMYSPLTGPQKDTYVMSTRRQFIQCGLAAAACTSPSLAYANRGEEWKSLFDGKSLKGWKKVPRIYVHGAIGEANTPEAVEEAIKKTLDWHRSQDSEAYRHLGDWKVVDGAIVGGQDPPGSRLGAYLMTEEE